MLSDRLRELRKEQQLSQRELASKLDISQQSITAWETGRSEPTSGALTKLANFFNVSTDYLLGQTDVRKSQKEASKENSIDKMLDDAMSNDGKPMTENDREIIKSMIEAYLKNKK